MRIKRLKQSAGSVQNRWANNTGLQQQIFRVEKIAGESSGVDPPRCGSHRTAMPTEERRGYGFSEICIVAAIRGCRVHLFQILASKTGLLK